MTQGNEEARQTAADTSPYFAHRETERERGRHTHSRDRRDYFRDMVAASLPAVARRIHNSGSSGNDSSLSAKSADHHAYVRARVLCISLRTDRPTHARTTLMHAHTRNKTAARGRVRSCVREMLLRTPISLQIAHKLLIRSEPSTAETLATAAEVSLRRRCLTRARLDSYVMEQSVSRVATSRDGAPRLNSRYRINI